MRLRAPSPRSRSADRSGVALIVTIIMISVITFLTVAFLALSGREKGSVKTATNQATARLAADQALERAKVEMLAGIMATRNFAAFDLSIATNYINYDGFDPSAVDGRTNVNYNITRAGGVLSFNERMQNLGNLLIDPRPPVFVTNRVSGGTDFRYYLDLNRNGRHDLTGIWPELSNLGTPIVNPTNASLTNLVWTVGDPEWIGILERPNLPHSGSNRFTARYTFLTVPEGKTLDINFMHNNAKDLSLPNGFLRSQGFGTWDLNLAAFLADLNTNIWNSTVYSFYGYPVTGAGVPNVGLGGTGAAFDDAYSIWQWRRGGVPQQSIQSLFGVPGSLAFRTDLGDGYSGGAILIDPKGYNTDPDSDPVDRTAQPWPGADLPNRYFSIQDLFDPTKTSTAFVNRMNDAGNNLSTYDSSTYYRLLAQLGTASAPEDSSKINLNYVNIAPLTPTNFVRWNDTTYNFVANYGVPAPILFFTNAVDRLLRAYSEEWIATDYDVYTNIFRMTQTFGVTNIPVIISNQWVYSPAVHRALQLVANIWETKNNTDPYPVVFRPTFRYEPGTNVYISGFVAVSNIADLNTSVLNRPAIDLLSTNDIATALPADGNILVYGAPPVLGARKGLPNFNEYASELLFSLTRKIQVVKAGTTITQTNQIFALEALMPSGFEFWNSYATNFTVPVSIYFTNIATMTLTNDTGLVTNRTLVVGNRIDSSNWRAARMLNSMDKKSFITNVTTLAFFPPSLYTQADRTQLVSTNPPSTPWDVSQQLIMPRWGITFSNRVQATIVDASGRIIDYVSLGNLVYRTNITDIIADSAALTDAAFSDAGGTPPGFKQLWATNLLAGAPPGGLLSGRLGVIQQLNISMGAVPAQGQWASYGKFTPNAPALEATKFKYFMLTAVTNGAVIAPFTPSFQFRVPLSWQANDPLVHYLSGDLFDTEKSGIIELIKPEEVTINRTPANIGALNTRYNPWPIGDKATGQNKYTTDVKDPLVRSSDEWQFPTNVLPTIGWIGRIHRGTPWQTVYLKASDMGWTTPASGLRGADTGWTADLKDAGPAKRWSTWSGNRNIEESFYYRPAMDRLLFDVFTVALNDNSTRGRLNINQTNLAAWSAVFSGVVTLTNRSTTGPVYGPWVIDPAGVYNPLNEPTLPPLVKLVNGINQLRTNSLYFPTRSFTKLGDILGVPQLTDASPFLNRSTDAIKRSTLTDAAVEWLPQQVLPLLHLDKSPRFSVYAYGQSLQPAPDSIQVSLGGLCTNYAITAETALRAVVRVEGSSDPSKTNSFLPLSRRYPPRVVVESFNYLPPD